MPLRLDLRRAGAIIGLVAGLVPVLFAPTAVAAPAWLSPSDVAGAGVSGDIPDLATDPAGDAIAVWRQIADNNQSDGMMFARSTNNGQTWSAAQPL